ncbi:MAG: GOLPH3/VPS74 family protein, partial [Actinomycetes bacterium]
CRRVRTTLTMNAVPQCPEDLRSERATREHVMAAKNGAQLLIAEDLVLLLVDDATGKPLVDPTRLDHALAGAVLVELALRGRVEVVGRGRLVVTDPGPTSDPVLDEALRRVADRKPAKPERLLGVLLKQLRPTLLTRLADRGLIRREPARMLGLIPTSRWPALDPTPELGVRHRLHEVVVAGASPDPRTRALISLLSAVDALPEVLPGNDRRELRRRGRELARGDWAATAVSRAVNAINAGVAAAAVAAAAAGAGS